MIVFKLLQSSSSFLWCLWSSELSSSLLFVSGSCGFLDEVSSSLWLVVGFCVVTGFEVLIGSGMVIGLGVVTGFGTDVNGIGDEGDDEMRVVNGLITVVVSFELGLFFVVVSFELGLGGGHTIKA